MPENQIENNNNIGELLTKAREKLSLSQEDIASRLNLKEEFIAALDANDFDKLPAPTYIKGYIRSYACAVDLDTDSLINMYKASEEETPPEILPDVKPTVQASSKDKPVKVMTYLIIFTLGILIIAWWQNQHIVRTKPLKNDIKATSDKKYLDGLAYDYDIAIHPKSLDTHKTDESDRLDPEDSNIANLDKSSKSKPDDHLLTNDSLSLDTQINSKNQINLDILKMELTAESWVEVHDFANEELYRNLAKAGEKIIITGTAPLSVQLGNSIAVSVNFNGQVFDTKAHTRANVARFLLE